MVRPALPKPTATQTNAPKTVAKAKTDGEQSAASKSQPEHDKQDLNQANIPTQLVGKPYPPGFVLPVGVTPSSKSATSTSRAQANTAVPGQLQQPQGTRSSPTTPSAQKPAAAGQGTSSSSKLTEKPAGGVQDMSQQVTRKDATVPTQHLWSDTYAADVPTLQRGAIVRTPTLPPQHKFSAEELPIELEDLPAEEVPTGHVPAGFGRSAESFAATSKVAEHWRNSWRERQRAEAGPAVEVSRGQASVPMPLMAMQHSIARMRAVILNNKQAKQSRTNFTFWLTLLLMVCLIGGLGAYVLSTYMFNSPFGATRVVTPAEAAEPTLTLQGPQTGSFTQNSTLHLHGEHFGRGDIIALLLDTISPLLSVQANAKGIFDASLHIGSDWSVGAHLISAQDTRTNQIAYMNIEVSPQATPETTSPNLSLSKQQLTFSAVSGESNPSGQQVTLTNTSDQALQWSVMAVVDNNLSWLILDPGHLRGTLDVSGKDSINVSIITAGLAGSSKPYSGQILFTINGKEQLMLPVQLYIHDPSIEVVVNPNLIIAQLAPGGTCKPTTLTLINLSNKFISWSATPYAPDQAHIHLNNKPAEQGQLQPTGTPGDTEVLALTCINVHLGEQLYHITVYYDNVPQDIPVSIRP